MYGIPSDIDWSFFVDTRVEQICIGKGNVQVHLFKDVSVSMCGDFDHLIGGKPLSDSPDVSVKATTLISLLEAKVEKVKAAPKELSLLFSNGEELIVYDSSEQYESFTVTYPGGATIVV